MWVCVHVLWYGRTKPHRRTQSEETMLSKWNNYYHEGNVAFYTWVESLLYGSHTHTHSGVILVDITVGTNPKVEWVGN